MNDKVRLVTTEGCEGCRIMTHIINEAIKKSTYTHIELEVIDFKDAKYKQFLNRYFVKDFPAILFMRENEVLCKFTGTNTIDYFTDKIKYWFGKALS